MQIAGFSAAGLLVTIVFLVVTDAPWYLRILAFFPAAVTAGACLQVTRNTCVSRARTGLFEHEDFTATPAAAEDAAASRLAAATISRDSAVFGAIVALVSMASAFLS